MTLNVITVWEMVLEIRRTTLYNSHVHQLCDYALSLEHDEKLRKQIIADDEKQIESLLAQLAELRTQFHQQCDAMQVNADCDETTIESLRVEVSRLTAENAELRSKLSGRTMFCESCEANARDKERLDWLDGEHDRVDPMMVLVAKRGYERNGNGWGNTNDGQPVRRVIDTGMRIDAAALSTKEPKP